MAWFGKEWHGFLINEQETTMSNSRMQILKVKITGSRALMMHSDTLADPLNPHTKAYKALTSKRKKTDEDLEAIAQTEWRAGLYHDADLGPYIPGINFEASIIAGGKLSRLGAQLKRSIEVITDKCKLSYDGPRGIEALWNARFYDARSVKVQTSKIIRYRPLFPKWETEFEVMFDPEIMDRDVLIRCIEDAGAYCGVGDYRPKFGRFNVEVLS